VKVRIAIFFLIYEIQVRLQIILILGCLEVSKNRAHQYSKSFKTNIGISAIAIQNSEDNNLSNVIQNANKKSSVGQHGLPTNAKVGSGAMEECACSADRTHPP
jgi:hypothetical protein